MDDNLYVEGEIGIGAGGNEPGPLRFKDVKITNNVFMHIGRDRPTNRDLGWYIEILDWDGGLVSNTPLATVLEDEPRCDTLAFQVDLWSAVGPLPRNLLDVEERGKDIRFSSRTRAVTRQLERERHLRRVLREVMTQLPASARRGDAWCKEAATLACDKRFNVVHLIYKEKEWDGLAKDYEFGAQSMLDHWASGLTDVRHTLAHRDWLALPQGRATSVTHDVHRT
jgi:NTE family protein